MLAHLMNMLCFLIFLFLGLERKFKFFKAPYCIIF
jgi:hypothetical protein